MPTASQALTVVYKITTHEAWLQAEREGTLAPSGDDARDGFIHLSARHQVQETARRHFSRREGLCLAAYSARDLGPALVWEASRGGEAFPHYYGLLPSALVLWVRSLPLSPDGIPQVDAAIAESV